MSLFYMFGRISMTSIIIIIIIISIIIIINIITPSIYKWARTYSKNK